MSIDTLIAHRLSIATDSACQVQLATEPLPLDASATTLIDTLKSGFFSRLTRVHGSFSAEGEPAPLAQELAKFTADEQDFVAFTSGLLGRWQALLNAEQADGLPTTELQVISWYESSGDAGVCYLLATGDKTAYALDGQLALQPVRYLDIGPALFGIKVDLHEWQTARHYAYLSFVPPRGNPALTDSFTTLTGFTAGLDKTDCTDTFLDGVEAFTRHVPAEQVDRYRNQVVDYCAQQEQQDAPVDLGELARSMEGVDGQHFNQFMADYTPEQDGSLMMDRRRLRRYVKFAGREKDLAISFSSSQLNSRVHYNPDTDTLSIDGIPQALRDQLLRHLNK